MNDKDDEKWIERKGQRKVGKGRGGMKKVEIAQNKGERKREGGRQTLGWKIRLKIYSLKMC